jgi:hypothetical protein
MKAVTASLGYPTKAAGYDAMFTVAKGSQAFELTLPAGSLGQLQPVPDALKGMTVSNASHEVISLSRYVASLQETALHALRHR